MLPDCTWDHGPPRHWSLQVVHWVRSQVNRQRTTTPGLWSKGGPCMLAMYCMFTSISLRFVMILSDITRRPNELVWLCMVEVRLHEASLNLGPQTGPLQLLCSGSKMRAPHVFRMMDNGTIFPHEAALYGTSISGWCLGSSGGAGKRWWNVGMPRQLSGVEWLIPSVGCFLCSNLHGRRRNKFWLMYVDAVNWVVYQVLVAAFLGLLRLLLDMFVLFSDASEVTFMQASRILRRQL